MIADILVSLIVLLTVGASAWVMRGRKERVNEKIRRAEAEAETKERVKNADVGEGNAEDDRAWLADAADRLRSKGK